MDLGNLKLDINKLLWPTVFFLAGWVMKMDSRAATVDAHQIENKADIEYLLRQQLAEKTYWVDFWTKRAEKNEDKADKWQEKYLELLRECD